MTAKHIIYHDDARHAIMRGIDKLANAVKITLGPKGRYVILEKSFGSPQITNDGVTIAKEIEFKDKFENMGAQLVKEVAEKTQENSGDGTTTATLLTQAIVREGLRIITAGANPIEVKRGIDKANHVVAEFLTQHTIDVKDKVAQVATISANNDEEIGNLIAQAIRKVGANGVITVEEAKSFETSLTVVEGMEFEEGYVSPYMITEKDKQEAILDDAYVLLYDKKISAVKDIVKVLEIVAKENRSLLIVADDLEGEALATIVLNLLRGTIKVVAVKKPGFGDEQKAMMEDIAVLTGGKVISEEKGLSLESVKASDLGQAKRIKVNKEKTVVLEGKGRSEAIRERAKAIEAQIKASDSESDRKDLQKRLAKLTGGVAVITVGASTETELREKKDRIDDAVHATKAALEEGIVAGGGTMLIRAIPDLEKLKVEGDQKIGVEIIRRALTEPTRQIALNAGKEAGVIIDRVIREKGNVGYNAKTDSFEDLVVSGVIDPTKVVKNSLMNAASIAGMVLTTEVMVADAPKESKGSEEPDFSGMGGMGGMPMM
ncbi:TPA: chaperonin GroEL [Candidatus Woesearchaeota archaeon]|nr:chaperonin GroEL [Candidatus Woesearchaeota archaeon]HII69513.1 chaperonin GroEL [Candidatus Woesearchaeota archaeon]